MIDLNKYKGSKCYLALESKIDESDPEEEDKVENSKIYLSIDEVMETASDGDEFIEVVISNQFKAIDKCMQFVEIKGNKIVPKS